MFAYCGNNPVMRIDRGGTYWECYLDINVDLLDSNNIGSFGEFWGFDSTSYGSYQIGSYVAAYDANLLGLPSGGISGIGGGTAGFAFGNVTVHDSDNVSSRGSTAVRQPVNLTEKLALEQVKSNPQGSPIPNIILKDQRWPTTGGWVKMQQLVPTSKGVVNIHYVYNHRLHMYDDFKITSIGGR